ncbi:TIP120-domain-containing protein [Polychaeton citri CBS 116435]|uniref:TIP120-domain-containing protein n=1 Tax=Polychaeton citri CBS 116435 TaxID=1314669 RepID=A0A9P4Q5Q4_9PEZI|nr:TIP120-domain-containing protein [Polychaeton citri CBS 116435]
MSSTVPSNPSSHSVATILPKLNDPDADIRFMTLNDLRQMLLNGHPNFMQHDFQTCAKVVEGLLQTLNDTHGEVTNKALECLGPFVNKAPESILSPLIEKVSNIKTESTVDSAIPALALRQIVVELPHPSTGMARTQKVQEAYTAVSRALVPRLVGKVVLPIPGKSLPPPPKGMLQNELESGNDSSGLDLIAEVARCYGPMLHEAEVAALEKTALEVLENDKCGSVMKKKAVAALSALSPFFSDDLLAHHVSYTIEQLRQPHLTSSQRRLYITVYGSLARSIPQKFGPYLKTLLPFVLAPLSQEELEQQQEAEAEADGDRDNQLEEVREAALIAVESFLQACPSDVRSYTKEIIDSSTRFLKYDPNFAEDDEDEDMEEGMDDDEFEGEEDFEEETGFDDEDDVSWKVRRSSAKVLHALLATLDASDPAVFGRVAPALIARFKEREESVRTEIIGTLAFLVCRTGSAQIKKSEIASSTQQVGRKRRRGASESVGSDPQHQQAMTNGYTSPVTPPPHEADISGLAKLTPEIVKASAKLLKSSTIPTKQAIVSLLKDLIIAQHGGLTEHADVAIDPVVETMKSSGTGVASNVAVNSLRVEVLGLLRVLAEMHSSSILQPHLPKIIPELVAAARDRYAKVSGEAFYTIEAYVKALTPPRSAASKGQNAHYLSQLYTIITERISAQDADTEVRQKAVRTLGLLIGRTSGTAGSSLLTQDERYGGQQLLLERLRNELTRLACVRAVDTVAVLSQSKKDYKPDFVGDVSLELGAQLRKASRTLRGASLSALRMLATNQASLECMGDEIVSQLIEMLLPLLKPEDLHMMGPALVVLAAFSRYKPDLVHSAPITANICEIVSSPLSGAALDALVTCVEAMGKAGVGKDLMSSLLKLGVQGNIEVTGQVIGTLLVSGDEDLGITLDDFVKELQTQPGDANRCLALSVLGEAGLRMGTTSPLQPETFTSWFAEASEKVKLAAAVALGRAGAGNVKSYLPKILEAMSQGKQYLLLHSVKEILQHSTAEEDIKPYTKVLWENIISSGQAEDNKVVGAECIGRLAIIDPGTYLPQLQNFLRNPNSSIRGMVIAALRYTFSDSDASYNPSLQKFIMPMLTAMLGDSDLENQRLSLSTFESALQNKPELVLTSLQDLLPFIMNAAIVRPDLVREVTMGPFKHKVDDGLEIRKSAYETMYALLDTEAARSRLDMRAFYDRIIAGISDEHEIKILCCLVLSKLISIVPAESARRLDSLAQQFRTVLAFKPKENAVKQELEKLAEQNKAIIKITVAFNRSLPEAGDSRAWRDYFDWVRKEHPQMFKAAEEEFKHQER